MSETDIKREILEKIRVHFPTCQAFRVFCGMAKLKYRVVQGADPGTPDICGFLPDGRFLGIEIKTEAGTFSKDQYEFAVKAARAGCCILGVTSWEECRALLQKEVAP